MYFYISVLYQPPPWGLQQTIKVTKKSLFHTPGLNALSLSLRGRDFFSEGTRALVSAKRIVIPVVSQVWWTITSNYMVQNSNEDC